MITDAHLAEANQLMIIAQARLEQRIAEARSYGGEVSSVLAEKIRTGVSHRAPKIRDPHKIPRFMIRAGVAAAMIVSLLARIR